MIQSKFRMSLTCLIAILLLLCLCINAQFSAPYLSAGESYTVPTIAATTGTGGGASDANPSTANDCLLFSILSSQGGLTTPLNCPTQTSSITKPSSNPPITTTSSTSTIPTSATSSNSGSVSDTSVTSIASSALSSTTSIPTNDGNSGRSVTKGPRGVGGAMPAVIIGFLLLAALTYFLDVLLEFLA